MPKGDNLACHDIIMDAAREWYLRLEMSEGSDAVQKAFDIWLSENKKHRAAFDQVVDFWSRIETLPEVQALRDLDDH